MKSIVIIALFSFVFTSAQEIYKTENYDSKSLNINHTAEIGSSMIEKGTAKIYEAIKIEYYPKKAI